MPRGHTLAKIYKTMVSSRRKATHVAIVTLIRNPHPNQISVSGSVVPPSDPTRTYPIMEQVVPFQVVHTFSPSPMGGFPGAANLKAVLFRCRLGEPTALRDADYPSTEQSKGVPVRTGGQLVVTITNGPANTDPGEVAIELGDADEIDGN